MRRPDLGLRRVALVVAVDAVGGVGEPDRAVRRRRHVVGRVQALALPAVGEDRAPAVVLRARHPAPLVLAGDEPPFAVHRVAVLVAAGLAEHRNAAVRLVEPHDAVVRDVREDEVAAGGEIGRAFQPAPAGPEALQPRAADRQRIEARVEGDVVRHAASRSGFHPSGAMLAQAVAEAFWLVGALGLEPRTR